LGAVERDREVELLGDVGRLLDEDLPDPLPLRAGLVGDELHAEDLARQGPGLGGRVGELDAASLAAAAGMDLRLDDTAPPQLLTDPAGLLRILGNLALRGGDPVAAQDLLRLVLVDLQFPSS